MQSKAPKRRRGPLVWIKRALVGLGIGLAALALIGAIYQAIATEIDQVADGSGGRAEDHRG